MNPPPLLLCTKFSDMGINSAVRDTVGKLRDSKRCFHHPQDDQYVDPLYVCMSPLFAIWVCVNQWLLELAPYLTVSVVCVNQSERSRPIDFTAMKLCSWTCRCRSCDQKPDRLRRRVTRLVVIRFQKFQRQALRYGHPYNFCFHGQAVRRSWERGIAKNRNGNGGTRRAFEAHPAESTAV